jgi:hypothetical protein
MFTITVTYPTADALIAGRTKREIAAIVDANPALTDADRAAITAAIVARDARKGR